MGSPESRQKRSLFAVSRSRPAWPTQQTHIRPMPLLAAYRAPAAPAVPIDPAKDMRHPLAGVSVECRLSDCERRLALFDGVVRVLPPKELAVLSMQPAGPSGATLYK